MAEAVERTDELVREYLLFRGFTYTLRQLEAEIKADKEKGFRVRGGRAGAGGGGRRPCRSREPGAGSALALPLPPEAGAALSQRRERGGGPPLVRVWPSPDR